MHRLTSTALALATLTVAACGDDPGAHATAHFAGATDAQLLRAIDAARFEDAEDVFEVGAELFASTTSTCPRVTTAGQVSTVTTDCTTDDGLAITGSMVITNFGFAQGPARDPAQPSTIEVDHLLVAGIAPTRIDGTLAIEVAEPIDDQPFHIDAVLDFADGGLPAHTEAALDCDGGELCTVDGWIGVDGLGEATVDPAPFQRSRGRLVLHGADTLAVDLAVDDQGCRTATIDGATRMLCDGAFRRPPSRLGALGR